MNVGTKLAITLLCATAAMPAFAADTIVTPSSTSWSNLPAEDSPGATAAITNTSSSDGNGSIELKGDRTRFATGTIYPTSSSPSLAALGDVLGLTFQWSIAGDSVTSLDPDYTPALRLSIFDGLNGTRKDLIWEGAYNGVYGPQTVPDTWYTSSINDKFYMSGTNENSGMTIAQWAAMLGPNSFVGGISVGDGSGAGAGYHAFADNVTLTTTGGTTTFDFAAAAVPEPATWALMLVGFGGVGASLRGRKRIVAKALLAA